MFHLDGMLQMQGCKKHIRNLKKDIGEGFNPYPNITMLP